MTITTALHFNSVFTIIFFGAYAHAIGQSGGCGTKLGKGTLICGIGKMDGGFHGKVNINAFRANLCTHATVDVELKCANDVCNPVSTPVVENTIAFLKPSIPVGIYLFFSISDEEYLNRRTRRANTVRSIVNFMEYRNLSFIQFDEPSWHGDFKNNSRRSYLDLIEDFSEHAHARRWHIGMTLQVSFDSLYAIYDFEDLARYVDWFNVPPHNRERIEDGKLYLESYYPLKSKTKTPGTVQYWIEYLLQWLRPECLLVELDLRGKKYVAFETDYEPGPGSQASPFFVYYTYKEICLRTIDDRCIQGWDNAGSTPFSVCGKDFYTYDNATSVALKVDLVKSYNLVGMTVWPLSNDDEEGVCGGRAWPNLQALQDIRKKAI